LNSSLRHCELAFVDFPGLQHSRLTAVSCCSVFDTFAVKPARFTVYVDPDDDDDGRRRSAHNIIRDLYHHQSIFAAMHLAAVLAILALFGSCVAGLHDSRARGESVFGIEFSTENIIVSFVPPGGRARGIASVKGNEAYRDLMHGYFELCYWAHSDHVPPWSYGENGTTASYAASVAAVEGIPNQVSWRYKAHPDETDVDILANAIGTVKKVTVDILADQYNITMPERPVVALAAPNFMWTMTEPEFWNGGFDTDGRTPYNYDQDDWHHGFAVKMSNAVQRAGFRLEPVDDADAAISPRRLDRTFPIAPASYAAFWNPNFLVDADSHLAASHRTQYEGPPTIVLELTNATLSLWAQRKGQVWSPCYTRPQLGAHIRYEDFPNYMYSPDDWVWNEIVFMIQKLRSIMSHSEDELLHVYLTGDAWEEDMVDAFREHLRISGNAGLEVVLRGGFAGSNGAACAAKEMLDESVTKP
jgi:hypothetical protein